MDWRRKTKETLKYNTLCHKSAYLQLETFDELLLAQLKNKRMTMDQTGRRRKPLACAAEAQPLYHLLAPHCHHHPHHYPHPTIHHHHRNPHHHHHQRQALYPTEFLPPLLLTIIHPHSRQFHYLTKTNIHPPPLLIWTDGGILGRIPKIF